jgi:hypothetical protein
MTIKKYLQTIGAEGGKAGKGASKRRPRAHYVRAAKLSAESRARKKLSEAT